MQSRLNPYISFKDNARQAMEFYKTVFGGKLTLSTFKEYNLPAGPGEENNIMHAMLEAPNGLTFMGADTPTGMTYTDGARISIALSGDDDAELTSYFDKLSVGANVNVPLAMAPWGDKFGMLTDQFGINWMVNIATAKNG